MGKWAEQYRAQQQVRGQALATNPRPGPVAPTNPSRACLCAPNPLLQAYSYGSSSSSGGSGSGEVSSGGGGGDSAPPPPPQQQFLLPLMTLSKAKMPTESVPLQIFEPRYRLMFKLVNSSASRRFGVVLADKNTGLMESGESALHKGVGEWRVAAFAAAGVAPS